MKKLSVIHPSRFGQIKILRSAKDGMVIYQQKGGNQSAADQNGVSLDTYVHALFGLTLQSCADKILLIGCAGGTLATMLHGAGRHVTAVDIDPTAFRIARNYFGLPRGVRCIVDDGLEFIIRTRAKFDVIIVDAFIGEKIPSSLTSNEFCTAARRILKHHGVLLFNVCLDGYRDKTADDIGLRLKHFGWSVRLLDEPGPQRNAIILAGNVGCLRCPRMTLSPAIRGVQIKRALAALRFRRLRMHAKLEHSKGSSTS